jgi:protein-glutamine gamma-glutamyltransferase
MDISQISSGLSSSKKIKIAELMAESGSIYEYRTIEQLEFELEMRLQVIDAAVSLNKSGVEFSTFMTSRCNERYWRRTQKGAFALRRNILPQTAIEDIFLNGNEYAFECATAIVIIFYKAVLQSIDKGQFNRLFTGLYLYDWLTDQDLGIHTHKSTDFIPGDCVYFKNPDVSPKTPQWQGENAIVLDKNLYYGHPIGIRTRQFIIDFLNTQRKEDAYRSAYLSNQITLPDFQYLHQFRSKTLRENISIFQYFRHSSKIIICEVGSKTYVF